MPLHPRLVAAPATAAVAGSLLLAGFGAVGPAAAAAAPCPVFFDADGDGHDDLVLGTPGDDVTTDAVHPDAGSVLIVSGDGQGRFGSSGSRLLTQESLGMGSQDGDRFGAAVASSDLDGDGCADLAIGMPGQNAGSGLVVVVYGTPSGLDLAHPQLLRQGSAPVGGSAEPGDGFGATLAVAGSLPGGGAAALWVGAPREDVGRTRDAGVVTELRAAPGSPIGSGGSTTFRQGAGGVPGSAETGDRFGERLVGGPNRMLLGVPHEDVGSRKDAGAVSVFGVSTRGWATYTEDSPGMPGTAEPGDRYGSSLAQVAGCQPGDEIWAVGIPGEDLGSATDTGALTLWDRKSRKGSTVSQGRGGVPDAAESGDSFGAATVPASVDGSTLAVGAPGEDTGGDTDSGALTILTVDCRGTTPAVASAATWRQSTTDVAGERDPGNRFAAALGASWVTTGTGAGFRLVVGAPGQTDAGVAGSGTVTVFVDGPLGPVRAGSAAFGQGPPGIDGDPGVTDGFGGSLDATNALVL